MSMELIDKNKIKYLSIPIAPVLVGEDVHYEMGALKEWIDDMPTVKAIPIEVVEQIREEIDKLPIYIARFTDCAEIHICKDSVLEIINKALKE